MARSDCGQRWHILNSKVSLQSCQRTGLHLLAYSPDTNFRSCAATQYFSIKSRVHKPGSIFYLANHFYVLDNLNLSWRTIRAAPNVYTQQQISHQPRFEMDRFLLIEQCLWLAEMTTVLEVISSDGIMANQGNSPRERRQGRHNLHFEHKCFWGGGNEFWQCLRLARSPTLEFGFDLGEDKSKG